MDGIFIHMPTGVYAELRNASNRRFEACRRTDKGEEPSAEMGLQCISPEYKGIYTHIDVKGVNVGVKKKAPTPEEIVSILGVEGIIKIWKDAKLRGNGHKKVMLTFAAAMRSID